MRVGDVLELEVQRVVEPAAGGVARAERALVQRPPRRLLVHVALGLHVPVAEEEAPVLEAQLADHAVAVEGLVDGLAADLKQPRACGLGSGLGLGLGVGLG